MAVLAIVGALALYGIYTYMSFRELVRKGPENAVEYEGITCEHILVEGSDVIVHAILYLDYKTSFRATLNSLDADIFVGNSFVGWVNLTEKVRLRRGLVHIPVNVTLPLSRIPYIAFEVVNSSLRPNLRILGTAVLHTFLTGYVTVHVDYSWTVDLTQHTTIELEDKPIHLDGADVVSLGISEVALDGRSLLLRGTVSYGGEEAYGDVWVTYGPMPLAHVELEGESYTARIHIIAIPPLLSQLLINGEIVLHFSGNITVGGEEHVVDDDWRLEVPPDGICDLLNRVL